MQSQVGAAMEPTKFEEVLYYLFGQDYKDYKTKAETHPRWNKSPLKKGQRGYPRKHQHSYTAEEYDPEFTEDFEDAYVQDDEFLDDEQALG